MEKAKTGILTKKTMRLLLILWLLPFLQLKADLPYMPLQFYLSSGKQSYFAGEKIKFTLTIQNNDPKRTWPVVLPDKKPVGRKLVYFRILKENNGKLEVAGTELRELHSDAGTTKITYLKPGQKTHITLYLNDMANYYSSGESNHYLPVKLDKGNHVLQVFYNPEGIASQNLYTIAHNTDAEFPKDKLVFLSGGELSTLCKITIVNKPLTGAVLKARTCGSNCRFCANIEKQRWNKVAKHIEATTQLMNREGRFYQDTTLPHWLLTHRNVACLSDMPESILSSLPSYYSREVGFKTAGSVHYYSLTFQVGTIYRGRSRMQQLVRCLLRNGHLYLFKTEDINYTGLRNFTRLMY